MISAEQEKLLQDGFTRDQIDEINAGVKAGLNTALYAHRDFLPVQMHQIRLGLEEDLPVSLYAKPEFDWFQMEEIRKGLKAGVDVSRYTLSEISYDKMREIRKGLESGMDLSHYVRLDAGIIRQLRKAKSSGVNLLKYINEGYDADQLDEIRVALEKGVTMDPFLSKEYRSASLAEIRLGLENRVDVSLFALSEYKWRQMREIRLGLESRVPVEKYAGKLYSWDQMREIRLGLEQGLDVEGYRLLRYTAGEMRKKRIAMLEEIRSEQEALRESRVKSEDFLFEFSANNMDAYITVLTQGKEIHREDLQEILEANNIRKGIREEAVEQLISGRYGRQAILIAQGQIPHKGEDGWYEFFFRTNLDRKPKVLSDGSVDYQNIDWFEMVQEGWELAYYHEAKEGTDGYNVSGEVIKARKGQEQRTLKGQGFRLEEDRRTYVATMSGMIRLDDNEMSVTNHMVLEEVTMATGNVRFDGSIHVLGNITSGTVVEASGDIVVDGNVEAAAITSGGSVVLKKGMNSAGRGTIQAGKDVVSRFFEAARVIAKGDIEVDKCLNSQLYANGKIICTRTIAGGIAQAEKGYRVNHVGNQVGIRTVLKLKVDDTIREENKKVKASMREVKHELELLSNTYKEYKEKFPPEVRCNMGIFAKIENAVFAKKQQYEKLVALCTEYEKTIKVSNESKIIIGGQAHEGTILEMNGCRWLANDEYNITVKRQDSEMEVVNN